MQLPVGRQRDLARLVGARAVVVLRITRVNGPSGHLAAGRLVGVDLAVRRRDDQFVMAVVIEVCEAR